MPCEVVFNRLSAIAAELRPRVGQVVQGTCRRIEQRAKTSMTGAKHGRTYRKGAIKGRSKADRGSTIGYKFHRASAPGEAPAVDTGVLMNSIRVQMTSDVEGMVYTNTDYAPVLEFGGAKMAARPFLGPAGNAERGEHVKQIETVLRGL